MDIVGTECCALAHLYAVRDYHTAEEIVHEVKQMGDDGYCQKCLFVVTRPEEKILEKTLRSIGFKKKFLFPRVENKGMLALWVALVSDIKLKPKAAKRKVAKPKPRKTR